MTLRNAVKLNSKSIARHIVAGVLLNLTPLPVVAATIVSFTSNCGSVPGSVTATDLFAINLNTTCAVDYNYVSGSATTYTIETAITNDTGQIMTDLHFELFTGIGASFDLASPTPSSSPFLSVFSGGTSTTMNFVGPPNLPVAGTTTVSFDLTLPAHFGSGFDSFVITPSFNPSPTPELATTLLTGSGLFILGLWRRQRARRLPLSRRGCPRAGGLLPTLALSGAAAFAGPITVLNASFEIPPPGGLTVSCTNPGCFYNQNGIIPDWVTTAGSVSGELQLTNPVPVPYFNYIPDGDMIGYSNGGTISQTVAGTSITTGTVYTLTVAVGSRLDCCDIAPTVELVDPSNNAILAVATGLAPAPGNWSDWSGTYTGAAANAGHPLEIELISNGVQGDFDNVRLNQTATTPEPASLALMGLGLVGIAAVLGRRVRSPGPVKNDF